MDDGAGAAERSGIDPDKAALRARMLAIRDAIAPAERRRRSAEVAARVLGLRQAQGDGAVMLFASIGSEIRTEGLIEAFHSQRRPILLPVVEGGRLLPAPYRPGDPMVRGALGVPEPAPAADGTVDPGAIELVIAPGLAFDRGGYRLGYGRGFYDRFLAGLAAAPTRVGIGFAEQLLDHLPRGPDDQRLDLVVTDLEVVAVAAS